MRPTKKPVQLLFDLSDNGLPSGGSVLPATVSNRAGSSDGYRSRAHGDGSSDDGAAVRDVPVVNPAPSRGGINATDRGRPLDCPDNVGSDGGPAGGGDSTVGVPNKSAVGGSIDASDLPAPVHETPTIGKGPGSNLGSVVPPQKEVAGRAPLPPVSPSDSGEEIPVPMLLGTGNQGRCQEQPNRGKCSHTRIVQPKDCPGKCHLPALAALLAALIVFSARCDLVPIPGTAGILGPILAVQQQMPENPAGRIL